MASWPLLKLPVDWAATANTPSTCRWEVDGAQEWVRLTLPTGTQWWFQVCSDGQIQRLSIGPAVVPTTWSPACVLDAPPVKDPTRDMQYLAGPWDSVKVDPSVWTLGTEPLFFFVGLLHGASKLATTSQEVHRYNGVHSWEPPGTQLLAANTSAWQEQAQRTQASRAGRGICRGTCGWAALQAMQSQPDRQSTNGQASRRGSCISPLS